MLAIVFWNTRKTDISRGRYETSLRAFHDALNSDKPDGFRFSTIFRVEGLPWFKSTSEIYEDWYVIRNFAAMDALDHAVMQTLAKAAHRDLMKSTAGASGAIVGLTKGVARVSHMTYANWLYKPREVSADDFVDSVNRQLPDGKCSLWTRAMALGPTEHCLLSSGPANLSQKYRATVVRRTLVWQPSSTSQYSRQP